jgi:hypothetical protein
MNMNIMIDVFTFVVRSMHIGKIVTAVNCCCRHTDEESAPVRSVLVDFHPGKKNPVVRSQEGTNSAVG